MGKFTGLKRAVKKFRDRHTHELPTGPHTDVKKRRLNPSLLDKSIESGRTKERKRKGKIMGMGVKNVLKRMGGQKEGGRIGLKKGSVSKPGTHSWYLQHMNKNKKASGGRANFRDGGSVGAAIRGHGAEIK